MPKDTKETDKKEEMTKNSAIEKQKNTSVKETKEDDKKFRAVENKSVQNKVIDNIKNFISKIIEMQEKVRRDEQEEKELKKVEDKEKEIQETENLAPKYLLEYYDLPFRYNETVVKILAQTPKRLFVYWDVSDKDKQTYINAFGEHFFNDTYPVLLVHNENKNYTKEIPINDFANSWYLDISNPRDKYVIQLGRKFKSYAIPKMSAEIENSEIHFNNDFLFIAMSNKLEVPNDHILFEEFKPYIKYRNVKTNTEEIKELKTTIYQKELKELYNELYDGQIESAEYDMLNPSSMGTSSSMIRKN